MKRNLKENRRYVFVVTNNISFVPVFKYLGHLIDNKLLDDAAMHRQIKG